MCVPENSDWGECHCEGCTCDPCICTPDALCGCDNSAALVAQETFHNSWPSS